MKLAVKRNAPVITGERYLTLPAYNCPLTCESGVQFVCRYSQCRSGLRWCGVQFVRGDAGYCRTSEKALGDNGKVYCVKF